MKGIKRIKKVIAVTVAAVLSSGLYGSVLANDLDSIVQNEKIMISDFNVSVEDIAISHFYSIMESSEASFEATLNNQLSPWLNGFTIDKVTPAYDSNDNLVAYAVDMLATDGQEGYVMVGANADMAPIIEFSLTDAYIEAPVFIMYDRSHASELVELTDSSKSSPNSNRPNLEEAWENILSEKESINTRDFANSPEEFLPTDAVASLANASRDGGTGITIPGDPGNMSFDIMSDFSGYSNHCGPTAAMNVIKYYDESNRLPGIYDSDLFEDFYVNMRTNMPIGTLPVTFTSGFEDTLDDMGHYGYDVRTWDTDWESYQVLINYGYAVPMIYYLDGGDWDWHWVVGTAWIADGSSNFVYAVDGWNRSVVYRSVGYDNDDVADDIVYANVGYN